MIDESLSKYHLEESKFYKLGTLYAVMKELGLTGMSWKSFRNDWIKRKKENGLLILPLKYKRSHYYFSGKMIKGIVKAFAPGGEGRYNYEEDNY